MNKLLLTLFILTSFLYANKKYCTNISDNQRSTVIYLDLSNTSYKKFATNLLSELNNNFLPHERVRILTINPSEVTIKEVFNSCAPKLTIKEIKKVKSEGSLKYMLGGNPIEMAKEDYSFFMAELKNTLIRVYKSSIDDVSKKELIEMLYSESSTFEEKPMQRVIIFSDMIQNSEFLKNSSILDNKIDKKVLDEYKVNFNYSELFIYTGKKRFSITKHNSLMNFWKSYIEQNKGFVSYFNDNLKLAKYKYQISKTYEGQLELNGKKYESKLYLNFTENKKTTNSWFIINEIDSIPIKGTVSVVNGKLTNAKLKINYIKNENHKLFVGDEKFIIKVRNGKLIGDIKIDNAEVILNGELIKDPTFKITMKEVKL